MHPSHGELQRMHVFCLATGIISSTDPTPIHLSPSTKFLLPFTFSAEMDFLKEKPEGKQRLLAQELT